MAYLGNKPTSVPLTSSDIQDGTITASDIADSTITSSKLASGVVANQSAFKNIIINGDMSIAQRGTSESGITGGGYKTIDRWLLSIGSLGTWTQSQSTDVPSGQGFAKSLKMDCTTAKASPDSGNLLLMQTRFEGQDLQYLKKGTANAESLTLSFWVKSNKTGTYVCEIDDADNSRNINKSYTINSANTWEKKEITFAGDTTGAFTNDNNLSMNVIWWLAAGSDFTSGTLQTSWGSTVNTNRAVGNVNLADSTANEWYITGVQLEAGTTASDFEFLPYDVNLQRCLRYYNEINQGNNAGTFTVGSLDGNNGTAICSYTYPVVMRTSPTASYAGTFKLYVASTGTSKTDLNIQTGSRGFRTLTGSVTGTSGQAVQIDLEDTTVKVKLSAEL